MHSVINEHYVMNCVSYLCKSILVKDFLFKCRERSHQISHVRTSLIIIPVTKFSLKRLDTLRTASLMSTCFPTQVRKGRRLHECYQVPDWRPNVSIFGVQFFWKLSFTISNVTQDNQQLLVQISICVSRCFSSTIYVSILDIIVFFIWSVLS
jgi:hypothetical protein